MSLERPKVNLTVDWIEKQTPISCWQEYFNIWNVLSISGKISFQNTVICNMQVQYACTCRNKLNEVCCYFIIKHNIYYDKVTAIRMIILNSVAIWATLYVENVTKLLWFTTRPQKFANVYYVFIACVTGNSLRPLASHIGTCIHSHIACWTINVVLLLLKFSLSLQKTLTKWPSAHVHLISVEFSNFLKMVLWCSSIMQGFSSKFIVQESNKKIENPYVLQVC